MKDFLQEKLILQNNAAVVSVWQIQHEKLIGNFHYSPSTIFFYVAEITKNSIIIWKLALKFQNGRCTIHTKGTFHICNKLP